MDHILNADKEILAVFDFDCTITTRDTLLPFLLTLHPAIYNVMHCIKLVPVLAAYKIQLLDNHTAKEKLLKTFLQDYSLPVFEQLAQDFSERIIPPLVKQSALRRIEWHQSQQHRCIIVSAGLEVYIKPWAQKIGFSDVLATKLLTSETRLSGKIWGQNCFGAEKVKRLETLMGKDAAALKEDCVIYAYGDSRGDRELLAAANYAYYRTMPE